MIATANLRWWLSLGALVLATVSPAAAGWSPLGGPAQPLIDLELDPGRPELLYARVIVSEDGRGAFLWRSEDRGGISCLKTAPKISSSSSWVTTQKSKNFFVLAAWAAEAARD